MNMIGTALQATAAEGGLSPTQIGARIGRTEASCRAYLKNSSIPPGDVLIRLMTEFPAFAARLGFKAVDPVDQAA
jgi:hypothetical protein